jgi:hypothetical protein
MFIAEDYWPVPAVSAYNIVNIIEAQKHVGKERTKKKMSIRHYHPTPDRTGTSCNPMGIIPFETGRCTPCATGWLSKALNLYVMGYNYLPVLSGEVS